MDRIGKKLGELRIKKFDINKKIRKVIRKWRGEFEDKKRNEEYGMKVI